MSLPFFQKLQNTVQLQFLWDVLAHIPWNDNQRKGTVLQKELITPCLTLLLVYALRRGVYTLLNSIPTRKRSLRKLSKCVTTYRSSWCKEKIFSHVWGLTSMQSHIVRDFGLSTKYSAKDSIVSVSLHEDLLFG